MRVRVSDKITKEEASSWTPGSNVLITSPMGSGKSYFANVNCMNWRRKKIEKSSC